MKRFYKTADVHADDAGGFSVLLDGRPIRTPKRAFLVLPTQQLAHKIASEWAAQEEDIAPSTMPLTGMANASIDLIAPDIAAFAKPLAAFGESDLLCYRAPEADLAAVEAAGWNPILNWAETQYGVEFRLITGIIHQPQPAETVSRLASALMEQSAWRMAALSPLITIAGSLGIALAMVERAFDAESLWQAVTLDERWQEEKWGVDDQALAARNRKMAEWHAASHFLDLI